jgi:replicative DNA helicase
MNLPHDPIAEEAVLGGLLIDPDAIIEIEPILDPEAFHILKNQWIYEAILELIHKGEPVDLVTVNDALSDHDLYEYIFALVERSIHTVTNVMSHAKVLVDMHIRRQYIRACGIVATLAHGHDHDLTEIQGAAEKNLLRIATGNGEKNERVHQDLLRLLKITDDLVEAGGGITGLTTGLGDFDNLCGGLDPGELMLVAARPGMGKSALESCWSVHMAGKGKRVLRVNLEMSKIALTRRMAVAQSQIPYQHAKRGLFVNDERERFNQAIGYLAGLPMWIVTPSTCTIEWLASYVRRLYYSDGLDVIFLDYVQLMDVIGGYANKNENVAEISKGLKAIAREMNIPVVAAAQLNRGVESRANKRPQLSDLRDSGALEQDADKVVFIYRDEYYNPDDTDTPGIAELTLAKNRNGEVGTTEVLFQGPMMRFANLAKEEVAF